MSVEEIKKSFLEGMRIRLISISDMQTPPSGTLGTVRFVDDMGIVHMRWDTGSSLGLVPDLDEFEILQEA